MSMAAEPNELRDDVLNGLQLSTQLEKVWRTPSGLVGALMSVDHKVVGRRYIVTAFAFLLLGGILAILMRVQLAGPEKTFLSADKYNQIFTMHGSTMMFLFAVPVMEAFAVYLVPLMVGTRNIAFPRLNAFSYWMFLFGGCFLWISFLFNAGLRCRLVFVCSPLQPAVHTDQAGRCLGADDHLYRGRGARGRRRDRRDCVQAPRAGHDPGPHSPVRLGHAGHKLSGDVRDAVDHGRVHVIDPGSPRQHPLL
ncbi:hypothetical protein ACVWW3_003273 [Bradyrhizobium sp. LM2.9]